MKFNYLFVIEFLLNTIVVGDYILNDLNPLQLSLALRSRIQSTLISILCTFEKNLYSVVGG